MHALSPSRLYALRAKSERLSPNLRASIRLSGDPKNPQKTFLSQLYDGGEFIGIVNDRDGNSRFVLDLKSAVLPAVPLEMCIGSSPDPVAELLKVETNGEALMGFGRLLSQTPIQLALEVRPLLAFNAADLEFIPPERETEINRRRFKGPLFVLRAVIIQGFALVPSGAGSQGSQLNPVDLAAKQEAAKREATIVRGGSAVSFTGSAGRPASASASAKIDPSAIYAARRMPQ